MLHQWLVVCGAYLSVVCSGALSVVKLIDSGCYISPLRALTPLSPSSRTPLPLAKTSNMCQNHRNSHSSMQLFKTKSQINYNLKSLMDAITWLWSPGNYFHLTTSESKHETAWVVVSLSTAQNWESWTLSCFRLRFLGAWAFDSEIVIVFWSLILESYCA